MSDIRVESRRHSSNVFLLLSALLALGCAAACRSTPAPPATPAVTVTADTLAVVDGREISRAALDEAYRRTRDVAPALSDEETQTARLNVLNDLILQDILLAKAAQLKLDVAQSEVDAAYANAGKNMTPDALQQELTKRNLTEASIREGLRRELITQKVLNQEVVAKISVTDQEINDFFNANRAQFNLPEESYRVAQIVVTPVPDSQLSNTTGDDAATPQAATAKVQMLMERLKAGASFGELAAGYSEDPETAPRGGDLGLVPVSRLKQAPPALRDAVLNKAPGSVTVASAGGSHTLVLVVAHESAGQRDLSTPEIREGITQTLRGRKEQLLRAAYLNATRYDAHIVNYMARRLLESYAPQAATQPAAPVTNPNAAK